MPRVWYTHSRGLYFFRSTTPENHREERAGAGNGLW